MSSPLSTLKKLKHTPLQQWGKPDNHARGSLVRGAEFQAEADHGSSIYDLHSLVTPNSPHNTKKTQKKGKISDSSPPNSPDPTPTVMQQLSSLRKRVRAQSEEIRHKNERIAVLEEALRVKKEISERRCMMLQKQVFEMENFLLDYNMIWVGSENTDAKEQTFNFKGLWTPPETSAYRPFHVNFDLVLEKIQELNFLAGEGETYIQTTAKGAQLAIKEPVELWLYQNGIAMCDRPFWTYREHKTQQFMQDLMDGYFPSALQEKFPDGVPFRVHDRRDEQFKPRQQNKTFPGHGHIIQGNNGKNTTFFNAAPDSGTKLCQTVKAGHVKMIGEDLERALQVSRSKQGLSDAQSNSVILVETPALKSLKAKSASDVTTLKIRSEDGCRTYLLKMTFSETIGHVRQYLDKHRGGEMPSYDIISAALRCRYDDNSMTIRACGLTANATLLLRTCNAT
ncbi:UBX domain-containing protein 11 [Eucyclogobius newberryi]|uniref:UBX domain-containing protein 11 n=1 Tax=Eucyclogobius newberryi TaxID=166745 RepID=UPI003B5B2FFC